jgi:cytochrome c2
MYGVDRVIETSVLPLSVSFISLPRDFAVKGGAIIPVGDDLILMDRLGNFFRVRDRKVDSLQLPKLRNGMREYLLRSEGALQVDENSMRALAIAFDAESNKLFASFTRFENRRCNRHVIASLNVTPATYLSNSQWEDVYSSQCVDPSYQSENAGGALLVLGRKLYFSVGYPETIGYPGERVPGSELYRKSIPNTFDPESSFGKIFSIDLVDKVLQLISVGHRNVTGLAATADSKLFGVENGPQGGDELNEITPGANYGWPIATFGTNYFRYDFKPSRTYRVADVKLTEPIFAFVPDVAPSSLAVVTHFNQRWRGDLLVGSLIGQTIFRLHLGGRGNVVFSEPIWIGHRVRGIAEMGSQFVLLTDDSLLAYISVDQAKLALNIKGTGWYVGGVLVPCVKCHSFEHSNPFSMAPSLADVVDRRIGTDTFGKYSDAMRHADGKWTRERLVRFLQNPQSVVPGTRMPSPGLDEVQANYVVEALADSTSMPH